MNCRESDAKSQIQIQLIESRNEYHEQLKQLLSFKEDIIIKTEKRKPYELPLESLVHIFEPAPQFSFYSQHSDDETKSFLQNRTKR